jgi:hypothetical protein
VSAPTVRHFLACLGVDYEFAQPLAPYTLRNVVFRLEPPPGQGYPFVLSDLWLFALLMGIGLQELSIEVFRHDDETEDGDEVEPELVAAYGPLHLRFGNEETHVQHAWHLRAVPFDRPGWFEFRVLHEDLVIAAEWLQLEV